VTATSKSYDGPIRPRWADGGAVGGRGWHGGCDAGRDTAATFDNKNIGTGKPVTVTGYVLAGADIGNYTLSQPAGLSADITAVALTVTGVTATSKSYDGPTRPRWADGGTVGGRGWHGGCDTGRDAAATFDNKNVGRASR